VWSRNFPIDI
jgi:hypothetical protein